MGGLVQDAATRLRIGYPMLVDKKGTIGLRFVLVLLGQGLELRARQRTGGAIKALLGLAPKTARRVTPQGDEEVPLNTVHPGDPN